MYYVMYYRFGGKKVLYSIFTRIHSRFLGYQTYIRGVVRSRGATGEGGAGDTRPLLHFTLWLRPSP